MKNIHSVLYEFQPKSNKKKNAGQYARQNTPRAKTWGFYQTKKRDPLDRSLFRFVRISETRLKHFG